MFSVVKHVLKRLLQVSLKKCGSRKKKSVRPFLVTGRQSNNIKKPVKWVPSCAVSCAQRWEHLPAPVLFLLFQTTFSVKVPAPALPAPWLCWWSQEKIVTNPSPVVLCSSGFLSIRLPGLERGKLPFGGSGMPLWGPVCGQDFPWGLTVKKEGTCPRYKGRISCRPKTRWQQHNRCASKSVTQITLKFR